MMKKKWDSQISGSAILAMQENRKIVYKDYKLITSHVIKPQSQLVVHASRGSLRVDFNDLARHASVTLIFPPFYMFLHNQILHFHMKRLFQYFKLT